MGGRKLILLIIIGIVASGGVGIYHYSHAETTTDFVCTANTQNGYVTCSSPPIIGDSGLFILDSENTCSIKVTLTLENRFVVEFGDHPDCKFDKGFTLALTLDE